MKSYMIRKGNEKNQTGCTRWLEFKIFGKSWKSTIKVISCPFCKNLSITAPLLVDFEMINLTRLY